MNIKNTLVAIARSQKMENNADDEKELELQKQHWWAQQNEDEQWIEQQCEDHQ